MYSAARREYDGAGRCRTPLLTLPRKRGRKQAETQAGTEPASPRACAHCTDFPRSQCTRSQRCRRHRAHAHPVRAEGRLDSRCAWVDPQRRHTAAQPRPPHGSATSRRSRRQARFIRHADNGKSFGRPLGRPFPRGLKATRSSGGGARDGRVCRGRDNHGAGAEQHHLAAMERNVHRLLAAAHTISGRSRPIDPGAAAAAARHHPEKPMHASEDLERLGRIAVDYLEVCQARGDALCRPRVSSARTSLPPPGGGGWGGGQAVLEGSNPRPARLRRSTCLQRWESMHRRGRTRVVVPPYAEMIQTVRAHGGAQGLARGAVRHDEQQYSS